MEQFKYFKEIVYLLYFYPGLLGTIKLCFMFTLCNKYTNINVLYVVYLSVLF